MTWSAGEAASSAVRVSAKAVEHGVAGLVVEGADRDCGAVGSDAGPEGDSADGQDGRSRANPDSTCGRWVEFDGEQFDRRDKLVALLGDGADEARGVRGVAEGGADLGDAVVEAAFEVDLRAVGPDLLLEGFPGDQFTGVFEEDGEDLSGLGLDTYGDALAT